MLAPTNTALPIGLIITCDNAQGYRHDCEKGADAGKEALGNNVLNVKQGKGEGALNRYGTFTTGLMANCPTQ